MRRTEKREEFWNTVFFTAADMEVWFIIVLLGVFYLI